ncbi:MAG: FecR domain-containing protein [Prevotellaceae bacterium]|jgi:ferric-dicitrate binding protein FerR (iron transport regulator)|nr:FecR domain-containing protein [Prevotellaceae bacterium]
MEDKTTPAVAEAREERIVNLVADALEVSRQTDMETKWQHMQQRMRASRRTSVWMRVQRVAALLTLPLLLAVAAQYYLYNKVEEAPVQWLEAHTNPGMTTSVTLPDGTQVYLNSESTLKYPQHFVGELREVTLSGEAYFEVGKNEARRFVVSTAQQVKVEVTGTRFNMEAYSESGMVATTLLEGGVNMYYPSDPCTKLVKLIPLQKLVYTSADKSAKLYATSGETETAWKDGRVIFKKTPLKEALRILEKRYNVEFAVTNSRLLDYSFTGTFTHQRLERILEYFKISSRIKWRYIDSPDIKVQRTKIEIY